MSLWCSVVLFCVLCLFFCWNKPQKKPFPPSLFFSFPQKERKGTPFFNLPPLFLLANGSNKGKIKNTRAHETQDPKEKVKKSWVVYLNKGIIT